MRLASPLAMRLIAAAADTVLLSAKFRMWPLMLSKLSFLCIWRSGRGGAHGGYRPSTKRMPIADAACVQLVAGSITPIFFSLELAAVTDFRTSAAAACRCHRRGTQPLMARTCNQRMRCKRKLKMRPSASAINYAADTDVNATVQFQTVCCVCWI